MKQEFNINNRVEFVLTERGASILNKRAEKLKERFPRHTEHNTDYKEGDIYRNQLWTVMQIFGGSCIGLGLESFCKEGTVTFEIWEG